MLEITSRQRPLTLLVIVVTAQILMMAYQIKRAHNARLIRIWAVEALMPLQRGGTFLVEGVRGGWRHYFALHHASEENDELRRQLGQLELRNRELESQSMQLARLSTVLNFRQANPDVPMLTALVVGANADSSSRTVFINRGSRDHVHNNLAVITPEGVVGKIIQTYPDTAQVLLLTDRESGVGALFPDTRTHGVIRGSNDPIVRMDYVSNDEKVHSGEEIVTSGEDRIFPKDLPVGTVDGAKPGNPFQSIVVKPAARIDRLEEVIVLLSNQELKSTAEIESASNTPSAPPDSANVAIASPSSVSNIPTSNSSKAHKQDPANTLKNSTAVPNSTATQHSNEPQHSPTTQNQ